MWNDIDFLRREVARLEQLLVVSGRHHYWDDDLRYNISELLEELEDQESKLWNALSRSTP